MLRICAFILVSYCSIFQVVAQENKQPGKITFHAVNIPLEEVLRQLNRNYSLEFFYSSNRIPLKKTVTIHAEDMLLNQFLTLLCWQVNIGHSLDGRKVILMYDETGKINGSYTLSGFVSDSVTGERLIGATIIFTDLARGTTTNAYGFYSYTLPKGPCRVRCSYMGYFTWEKTIDLSESKQLNIPLLMASVPIREIKLTAKTNDKLNSLQMGQDEVPLSLMKKYPSLLGEKDVIQFLKMMPGIQSANEAYNGLYVRGATPQQSTFLLDDAPLFSLYHLTGWFSTINPDALNDIQLYKSHLPAKTGGVLSSVIDIRMRDGNNQNYAVTGGIGTITSRLTIEGPIVKNKMSFIVSGRRTHLDHLIKLSIKDSNSDVGINTIYFYDLHAKFTYNLNQNNRFYLSGYKSYDVVKGTDGISWGNNLFSFRWNRVFSDHLFSNVTLTESSYKLAIKASDNNDFQYNVITRLRDYAGKYDFTWYTSTNKKINFGIQHNYQEMSPLLIDTNDPETNISLESIETEKRMIHSIYAESELELTPRLGLDVGARMALLHRFTSSNYTLLLMPQISMMLRYKLTESSSIKGAYSRNYQLNHGASIFELIIPFERYLFCDGTLKPQYADHFSGGYFHRWDDRGLELSVETYCSLFHRQYRFPLNNEILIGKNYQAYAIKGQSRAYGIESSLRKTSGRITGILNYTLSKVDKKEDNINNNRYFTPFLRP
jgi:hypothetical protein